MTFCSLSYTEFFTYVYIYIYLQHSEIQERERERDTGAYIQCVYLETHTHVLYANLLPKNTSTFRSINYYICLLVCLLFCLFYYPFVFSSFAVTDTMHCCSRRLFQLGFCQTSQRKIKGSNRSLQIIWPTLPLSQSERICLLKFQWMFWVESQ